MLTQAQIDQFRRIAKQRGLSEIEISREIARKNQELSRISVTQPVRPVQPTAPTMPVSQPRQPVQESGGIMGTVKNVAKSMARPFTETAKSAASAVEAISLLGDPIFRKSLSGKKLTAEETKYLANYKSQVPLSRVTENRNYAKDATQQVAGIASYAVPAGAGIKAASKLGAVSGGLMAYSEGDNILAGIMGGALGGALLPMLGKGITKAGKIVKGSAEDLVLRALRPSPSQQAAFKKVTGQNLKQFVINNKLFEKGPEQVRKLINPVQQEFDDIVKKSGAKVDGQSLLGKFASLIDDLKNATVPELQNKGAAIEKYVLNLTEKIKGEQIGIDELTDERKIIDKLVKQFKNDPVSASYFEDIRNVLQDTIREATEKVNIKGASGKTLKELGQTLRPMYEFLKIAERQQYLGQGSLPSGITQTIAGTVGGVGGSVLGGPAGAGVGYVMGSAATSVANNPKVISKATEAGLKVGEKAMQAGSKVAQQKIPQVLSRAAGAQAAGELVSTIPDTNQSTKENDKGNNNQLDNQTNLLENNIPQQSISHPIFGEMTKREVLLDALNNGLSGKQIDEIEKIYDKFAPEDNSEMIEALIERRKKLVDQGFSTASIDRELEAMGITQGETSKKGGGTATEKERMFNNASTAAQKALDLLNSGKIKSGVGQGTLGKVGEKLGTNTAEQQRYRASIALARTAARNALLGANMTEKELESIEAFIPEYNDAPNIAKEKLNTFIELMQQFSGMN
jgi:hypothetical protein